MEIKAGQTIGLLITDGVGIRNFVLGGLLEEATNKNIKVVVFHFFPEEVIKIIGKDYPDIVFERLPEFQETSSMVFWRKVMEYAHMHWANTYAMQCNLNRIILGGIKSKIKHKLARVLGSFYKTPSKLKGLQNKLLDQVAEQNDLSAHATLLKKHNIDVLFVTNQKSALSSPTVLATKSLKIPSVVFIFSWDNLTTKGRFLSPFDHFFVWGDIMKEELLKFYPEIAEKRISIVGTPQFNSYFNKEFHQDKDTFCKEHGLNPNEPIILYSGGTPDTTPQDQDYTAALGKIVTENPKLNNVQIILRPSPADDGTRFQDALKRYPNIKLLNPIWAHSHTSNWDKLLPQKSDRSLLLNTLLHSDIVINTASTMTIDAFLFGKPVINTAFDSKPYVLGIHIKDCYYKFEHYLPVVNTQAAKIVYEEKDFEQAILDYLENPNQDADNRELLLNQEIGVPVQKSNQVILENLVQISQTKELAKS